MTRLDRLARLVCRSVADWFVFVWHLRANVLEYKELRKQHADATQQINLLAMMGRAPNHDDERRSDREA